MYDLNIDKKCQKFIKTLPLKHQHQILNKIRDLLEFGHLNDSIMLKGIKFYRVDIGEYRIAYIIEQNNIIYIPIIGKRNDDDIYKRLKRI